MAASLTALLRNLPAETAALLAWPLAAGPTLAARTRAERCHDGTLSVIVLDATWRPEIERMRQELLSGLGALLPAGAVRHLVLQSGLPPVAARPAPGRKGSDA